MNIISPGFAPILKYNSKLKSNQNNSQLRGFAPLAYDCVSFSGKNFTQLPQTIEKARELGVEIYQNALDKISYNPQETIEKVAANLEVLPIEQLKDDIDNAQDYCAFFTARTDRNYNDYNHRIYVNTTLSKDKNKALIEAMDIGHEYTHYQQSIAGQEAKILKQFSSEWEYNAIISPLCSHAFRDFDGEIQAHFVKKIFLNAQDCENFNKYGRLFPSKRKVTKEELLALNNYKDEKEFQDKMNKIFDKKFSETIHLVLKYPELFDSLIVDKVTEVIESGQIDKLLHDMRKYCAYCAMKEKEAYQTECEIARCVLKTRKEFNLDAFVLYYDMLNQAFEKGLLNYSK